MKREVNNEQTLPFGPMMAAIVEAGAVTVSVTYKDDLERN